MQLEHVDFYNTLTPYEKLIYDKYNQVTVSKHHITADQLEEWEKVRFLVNPKAKKWEQIGTDESQNSSEKS